MGEEENVMLSNNFPRRAEKPPGEATSGGVTVPSGEIRLRRRCNKRYQSQ
jgi:hypothetical protein